MQGEPSAKIYYSGPILEYKKNSYTSYCSGEKIVHPEGEKTA